MSVRPELLRKYNVPGPRYTSYPTVPYWETTPTADQWVSHLAGALARGEREGKGAAIYVHVPFCRSLCTYCGCNTRITRKDSVAAPYLEAVLREWAMLRERLGRESGIRVSEIHLGGGTPTFPTPAELGFFVERLLATVRLDSDAELSIEADPRATTREHLETLARLGFRRISLGVQDFDPKVQEVVNRVQSVEQTRAITETARSLGFTSVNFDLIYGLPLQTLDSVRNTIERVREIRPDRIAFYAYAHVPWIRPGQRRYTEQDLPSGDQKRALYEAGRAMLEEAGYREIGMDHFALESDSLWRAAVEGTLHRNFMGYISREVFPLIGLGVSAIGDSWTAFAQNEKQLEKYYRALEAGELPLLRGHVLDEEDLVLRRRILDLMTRFRADWESESPLEQLRSAPARLAELERDGLVELTGSSCTVTDPGRAFLRNVCMAFDARLSRRAPGTELFSRTI